MTNRATYGLNEETKRYVFAITGKTAEELSVLNPEDEAALAEEVNGTPPTWPRELKGSFRGRGNINVSNRRFKTLAEADAFLDNLVKNGARQYG